MSSNDRATIVSSAFAGRRSHTGSKRLAFRQMSRDELERLVKESWDKATVHAATVAARHEDDDERTARQMAQAISDDIMGVS